jgi:DNA-binding response OmpR family regulator
VFFDNPDQRPTRTRPVVLLADDSLTIRSMVSARLERAGYDIELAVNGDEALDLAVRLTPDLYILDVEMPGRSGLEVTEQLRRDGVTAPVVLLTGLDGEAATAAGLAAGANEYITKPFSPQDLHRLVASLVPASADAPL